MRHKQGISFLVLTLLFLVGCFLSLFYGGSEDVDPGASGSASFIFNEIRIPKTITAIIAGGSLSVAGLILQVIFRNPLAGPYVLGISSGASLMVALGILAGNAFPFPGALAGKSLLVVAAITGSFLVTLLILVISKKVNNNVVLLLIGLMFAQICSAIQTSLEYFADPNSLKSFVIWGMGSLAVTTDSDLLIYGPLILVSLLALIFFMKPLNVLLLGQSYAQNAGIDFNKNRFYMILISSVLTGVTTAFCGPIAFVGIAVPILSRMIFVTSRQQVHFVSCLLLGAILLLYSDAICHSVSDSMALPINMITTFVGAPVIIYLMFKNNHW